jgi:hypothetical protein
MESLEDLSDLFLAYQPETCDTMGYKTQLYKQDTHRIWLLSLETL